jgi:hypothetical protein
MNYLERATRIERATLTLASLYHGRTRFADFDDILVMDRTACLAKLAPFSHHAAPSFEHIAAPVGRFHLVTNCMRDRNSAASLG